MINIYYLYISDDRNKNVMIRIKLEKLEKLVKLIFW